MSISEDFRVLGRLSYRQVVIVLLAGWVAWWLTYTGVSSLAGFIGLWLYNLDEQMQSVSSTNPGSVSRFAMDVFYLRMAGFVTEPLVNLAGLIAGFWIAYITFGRFKKAMVRNDSNAAISSPA